MTAAPERARTSLRHRPEFVHSTACARTDVPGPVAQQNPRLIVTEIQTDPLRLGRVAPMLPVTDMAQGQAFYRAALGLVPVFENGDPVGFCILQKDAAELHLTLQPSWPGQTFNLAHILVTDAAAIYEQVQAAGGRIIKRLQEKDYGLTAFVFEDPFGNRIDVGAPNR